MAKRLAQFTPQHGGPKIEFFQSSKSMEQFEKVVKWLNCFCKKVNIKIFYCLKC